MHSSAWPSVEAVRSRGRRSGPGAGAGDDSGREHLFKPIRLPGVQPLERAGAAPVFLQPPSGACPARDGWASRSRSTRRVLAFPSLSLASGATKGLGQRVTATTSPCWRAWRRTTALTWTRRSSSARAGAPGGAARLRAKRTSPFQLSAGQRAKEGACPSSKHPSRASCRTWRGAGARRTPAWCEDLARYRQTQPCAECGGARLRREARHVLVGEAEAARAIYAVSDMTLADAQAWFGALRLLGRQGRDRRQDRARDRRAPGF